MPKLLGTTPMETHNLMQQYKYTGQPMDRLGGSKYTLVSLALDMSPSIEEYVPDLERMSGEVVKACMRDPNKEAIMLRFTGFHENVMEMQGFAELRHYDPDQFKGIIKIGSSTALYEATYEALLATDSYGEELVNTDCMCNGVLFILTDGMNMIRGHASPNLIAEKLKELRKDEGARTVESINTILVCASDDPQVVAYCRSFKEEAGLSQLVEMGEANEANLAKLGQFVSQSISSTSQALGSGGPSQPLSF